MYRGNSLLKNSSFSGLSMRTLSYMEVCLPSGPECIARYWKSDIPMGNKSQNAVKCTVKTMLLPVPTFQEQESKRSMPRFIQKGGCNNRCDLSLEDKSTSITLKFVNRRDDPHNFHFKLDVLLSQPLPPAPPLHPEQHGGGGEAVGTHGMAVGVLGAEIQLQPFAGVRVDLRQRWHAVTSRPRSSPCRPIPSHRPRAGRAFPPTPAQRWAAPIPRATPQPASLTRGLRQPLTRDTPSSPPRVRSIALTSRTSPGYSTHTKRGVLGSSNTPEPRSVCGPSAAIAPRSVPRSSPGAAARWFRRTEVPGRSDAQPFAPTERCA